MYDNLNTEIQKIPCTNILNNIINDDFVEYNQNKGYKILKDANNNSEFKIFEKRSKNIKSINDK